MILSLISLSLFFFLSLLAVVTGLGLQSEILMPETIGC